MKPEIKKLLILNLPYLLFVWLFDKVGAAVRLSPGADASAKLLHLGDGFTAAFSSIAPSFHPADLALGIAGAVIVRLIIYTKGKNAKKYFAWTFWFSVPVNYQTDEPMDPVRRTQAVTLVLRNGVYHQSHQGSSRN